MRERFRKSVVIFYRVALPLCLLVCAGWLIGALMDPAAMRSWLMSAGAAAFALVIGWRLWLNSRSVGWGGPMPPPRRLLLVFLPLTILALAGLGVWTTGLAFLSFGIGLITSPDSAGAGFRDLVPGAVLYLGGGVLIIIAGVALTLPLLRSLRRKPVAADGV